ncbi:LPS assembly lipoprotein LptE [SCandidatus Aminicenantes bacterium Aminicenantia_JdfR_composite]|jgi:outer membrane lipopolysaccharide assembly protein LptE/RlpB|nr:LPS assembly lipoprotein LptE [SCandidatus Aminicenantes bacterium Aminicenantia_JdfR_composite]MCP2597470.1 LPS assembly lipoprotein LptE [Candidatus Aminicenantes bacterium AC-335-G13]MCP2598301.1 LPS assembly lipoprotein LptE [Candidatus Aminicenantes bacterium AC-335-L06]MCP2620546.1 LPS assembly lipoprotein LptE [Candidatus Aminicenantes bacterium AC-334-E05]
MNFRFKPFLILTIILCLIHSINCGYKLSGTGSFLPPHIKTISVPMFKNNTQRYQLDEKFTQAVINELVARGRFKISSAQEKADAILLGEINSFTVNPISFTEEGRADRYSITIVAKVVFKDLVRKKVLFMNSHYVFRDEYEITGQGDFYSEETVAIERISEKFARSVVSLIVEGF